jgi:general secretion pathway protein D
LKPTARILTGSIALLLGSTLAVVQAQQPPLGGGPAAHRPDANRGDARHQSDDLLNRARQAIQENNFAAANTLITQAEALGVNYGMLSAAYTPSKARAELQRKTQAGQTARAGLFGLGRPRGVAPSDPFQGMPAPEGIQPLPAVTDATPIGARAQGDQFLLTARRHLAVGDINQANRALEDAKRLNVRYSPLDDNPARVEALIASYSDVMAQQTQRGQTEGVRRMLAKCLLDQADGLLKWHDCDEAERLTMEAGRMNVPFNVYETNPQSLLEKIAAQRQGPVQAASHVAPATGPYPTTGAAQALYNPTNDPTRNMLVQGVDATGPTPTIATPVSPLQPAPQGVAPSRGFQLFQQGEAALRAHDTQGARSFFQQAVAYSHELDPFTQQKLQDMLQLLAVSRPATQGPAGQPSIIDDAAAKAAMLARQVSVDIAQQTRESERLRQTDPNGAIKLLEETKARVAGAGLEPASRDRLLRQVDRALVDTANYIEENKPRIELDQRNQAVLDQIEQERQMTLDLQQKLKEMVDRYNMLIDEQRYAEAEVVAKRAKEIAPNEMVAEQLSMNSRAIRRMAANEAIRAGKEEGFVNAMLSVDQSATPFDDTEPYVFGKDWKDRVAGRTGAEGARRQRTEGEMEIERRLQTPVLLEFNGEPLSVVVDHLSKLADVNVYLDPQGLQQEAVTSDMPVTISLSQEVMLKSALKLILEPLHLSYVIEDEVLKITSEQMRSGDTYIWTYDVADLVVPIPNFSPSANQGLAGAYNDAMRRVSFGGGGGFGGGLMGSPLAVMASHSGAKASAGIDPNVLAQMTGGGGGGGAMGGASPSSMPLGFGPGGAGGASMADFDSLISLITATVQPESWEDVGGPGSVAPFETNLSLVIRQTEEVHEEIVDLLGQLRRMQDLQVTIEVRFITLNDNFFERIGVDFDFDIDDDIDRPFQVFGRTVDDDDDNGFTGEEPVRNTLDVDHDRSVTVGMSQPGVFSADLDVPFQQGSFQLAVPQFGGFDATAGAQLGFAILSEIEAFFFISAAQGDRRSNIMQAPKVTLFNGQQAMVSDTSQSPFVVSVVPVVGDFAAAQQPVIVVLNEGTFMTVQAVVSDDRRFVRLTVVPVFSKIGEVNTFQFTGSTTTTTSSEADGIQDTPNDNTKKKGSSTNTRSGTTVQLPTYSFITVTTTVSVPDGGTVLLGGIKRLSEGRNEFGVPMLNKLPYVNRLFKNVGIGRETQSLMMMVTPRIIIQEEEEERLGIYSR